MTHIGRVKDAMGQRAREKTNKYGSIIAKDSDDVFHTFVIAHTGELHAQAEEAKG